MPDDATTTGTTEPVTTPPVVTTPPTEPDHKAEAEKWKALSRQNEAAAKANAAAAKELQAIRDAQKTAEEKANEAKLAAEKEASDARSELARYKVAAETGVPAHLLSGADEEALKASAKAILAFAGGQAPTPDLGQGNRGSAAPADPNAWLRKMAGR